MQEVKNKAESILCCVISGTGKTLVARALANECSSSETKVAFFMRKGADCLSKWVGESERQLRLLFDQVRDTLLR
jgi:ATPase family AAA domain-containing protein 2